MALLVWILGHDTYARLCVEINADEPLMEKIDIQTEKGERHTKRVVYD